MAGWGACPLWFQGTEKRIVFLFRLKGGLIGILRRLRNPGVVSDCNAPAPIAEKVDS